MLNKKILSNKSNKIEKVKKQLKCEFVGLDNVIDEIMDKVKLWYLYPETFDKPMTISLVGVTVRPMRPVPQGVHVSIRESHHFSGWSMSKV